MSVDVTISRIDNGFIVESADEDFKHAACFDNEKRSEAQALRHALFEAISLLGAEGSRYDKERLYLEIRPGDKYEGPVDDEATISLGGDGW